MCCITDLAHLHNINIENEYCIHKRQYESNTEDLCSVDVTWWLVCFEI